MHHIKLEREHDFEISKARYAQKSFKVFVLEHYLFSTK